MRQEHGPIATPPPHVLAAGYRRQSEIATVRTRRRSPAVRRAAVALALVALGLFVGTLLGAIVWTRQLVPQAQAARAR